ncbi:MAG: hypothetical protein JST92_06735, partial [Deltaproteobacteria bacterium]|nr:hypothetical protein [Deltaproteobacteria bacterium]
DLGARYEVHPTLRLGAEFWSTTSWEYDSATGDRSAHTANFVGPSLSVATGKFWLQLGAGFGLGDARSVFARSVLGMNL